VDLVPAGPRRLVVALTVTAVLLFVTTDPADGANIGLGLALLPLIGLGLTWSLPVVVDPYRLDELSVAAQAALELGPAYLNGALHALLFTASRRRSRPRAD
jgi:hypothetical protein